jgi:hypothetical protein
VSERSRFRAADPMQVVEAGRVWGRMFPHDRVAFYFLALGIHDPEQRQCRNDWYEIDSTPRQEIASQMLRLRGYFEEFDP